MKRHPLHAFTLVEMLAVMGVIVIMIAVVAPAALQTLRGSNISQSGETVGDLFNQARQTAITTNHVVQVRFYKLPVTSTDSATNFAGMQLFRVEDTGKTTPITKLQTLRPNIIFAAGSAYSTILSQASSVASVSGTDQLPAYNSSPGCDYIGFQYLPDGSTDLSPTATGGWFVTLVQADVQLSGQPRNFYTLRVEPLYGHTHIYRP